MGQAHGSFASVFCKLRKGLSMQARTIQIWLLCGARLFCQSNRLTLGGLMPLIAEELGLSTAQKGSLLSAFPFGYLLTQVLCGAASDRFGGKPVMALALFSVGVGITAFACFSNFDFLWTTMFMMGLLEGPSYPTNRVLLSRWVPPTEKAYATAVTDVGGPLGALIALFGTPLLADQVGWRATLLCCGFVTLLFTLVWARLGANDFMQCSYVSETEVKYLQALVP